MQCDSEGHVGTWLTARLALGASCLLVLTAGTASAQGVEQARIATVLAVDPGKWAIVLGARDEQGSPIDLTERTVRLFLAQGEAGHPGNRMPFLVFDKGMAGKGYSGLMKPAGKAPVGQVAVIVVVANGETRPETRDGLLKAVKAVLGSLKKDARVGLIFYGDAIYVGWSPENGRLDLRNVNDYSACLGRLRKAAAGEEDSPNQSGKVECGELFSSPGSVAETLKELPPGQGFFPRLFGIDEPPAIVDAARARGHSRLGSLGRRIEGVRREPFGKGALDAALRLILLRAGSHDLRLIVLFSDGKDGYLRVKDVLARKMARLKKCARVPACRKATTEADLDFEGGSLSCTRELLECAGPRVRDALVAREKVVAEYLAGFTALARAASVRVFTVATPESDEMGRKRLAVLARKTAGSARVARTPGEVALAGESVALELGTEVVVMPGQTLDARSRYSLLLVVDGRVRYGPYRFASGEKVWFFEAPLRKARGVAIRKLGHNLGPPVFWVVLVLGTLLALFLLYKLGKGIAALLKRLFKRGAKPPKPGPMKVPRLKRPPVR